MLYVIIIEAQARDLLPGEERTIIVKIEDHTEGTLSTEGEICMKFNEKFFKI